MNLVTTQSNSAAHAEVVAIGMAQTALGTHDFSTVGDLQLITSTEPCAMCLGAIPWSGLSEVVCGARAEDAENAGFNEGLKPHPWQDALTERDISVQTDVLRQEAAELFQTFKNRDGRLY